jgi:hypothetical protein
MQGIDFDSLKDVEEFQAILMLYNEAKTYVENFKWCKKIIKGWYDFGIYEKIGVFLFKIEPISDEVDDFIWIIVGDLPSAYLDCSVLTGKEALKIYCEIMTEWADNILYGKSVENCFPVNASPTMENANLLKRRIEFIKTEILK